MIERIQVANIGPFAGVQEVIVPEGLVSIEGRYHGDPLRSNRAGKTYLLDIPRFVLYGKYRHSSREGVAHRKCDPSKDLVSASLVLTHPEYDRMSISRVYDSTTGRFNISSPEFAEDLRPLKVAEQQAMLDTLLDCTYSQAEVSWMVRQGESEGIMKLSVADRKSFLLSMFIPETHPWDDWFKEANSRYSIISSRVTDLQNRQAILEEKLACADIPELKKQINEAVLAQKDNANTRDECIAACATLRANLDPNKIPRIRQQKDQLARQKTQAYTTWTKAKTQLSQADKKLEEFAQAQAALLQAQTTLEELQSRYDEEKRSSASTKYRRVSETLQSLEIELKHVYSQIDTMRAFEDKGNVCAVTGDPCEFGSSIQKKYREVLHAAEELEAQINKQKVEQEKLEQIVRQWDELVEEIQRYSLSCASFSATMESADMWHSNKEMFEVQVNEAGASYESVCKTLEQVTEELEKAIQQDDYDIRKKITEKERIAEECLHEMDRLQMVITRLQADVNGISQVKEDLDAVKKDVEHSSTRIDALSSLRVALSKDGIPFFNLLESTHAFELEVNRALYMLGTDLRIGINPYKTLTTYDTICQACGHQFTDSKVTCVICGTRRSHKRQETLEVQLQGTSYNVDFTEDSGGGMLLVSLAIRLALFSIYRERGQLRGIDFWFLDEVFSPLDISARNNMLQFLEDLRESYNLSQIFLISHTDMSDVLQPAIIVERDEEKEESYIYG